MSHKIRVFRYAAPARSLMATQPLTHHEILTIIEPFTRRGRHVDLAASDRSQRRLAFRAVDHPPGADGLPALQEHLYLEPADEIEPCLRRSLDAGSGLTAQAELTGGRPGDLLLALEALPVACQFRIGEGYRIALSHRLAVTAAGEAEPRASVTLTRAAAEVGTLALTLTPPTMRGLRADLELEATSGERLDLPEDLLAVLGWDWSPLRRTEHGYGLTLKLRGNSARREQDALAKLEVAARHLSRTLGEPPARFHQRWIAARWVVAFRRAIPLLLAIGLLAGGAVIPHLALWQNPMMRMIIFQMPPLLLMLFFCLREVPRFELPRPPRAPGPGSWPASGRTPASAGADLRALP